MKKSLLALSVAGAMMASTAMAAEVEVYGLIDLGLSYIHKDTDGHGSSSALTMENGTEFGSRFGIRGTEDLGNGYKVGFVLENGFKADDGQLDNNGKLFGREAHVDLYTPYGTISAGVLPLFGSVLGANGLFRAIDPLFANYTDAFGSGYATASSWTRVDNAISYVTPTFAGFTGYAMYSFKNSTFADGQEGNADADRYASLAVRYKGSALEAVLVADTTMYGNYRNDEYHDDTGYTVTLGGNYQFDNGFKLIAFGQYFKNQELNLAQRGGVAYDGIVAFGVDSYGYVDGYGLSIGAHYPLGGGILKGQIAYRDMDNDEDVDFTRWTICAGYDYPLSKRTAVYLMGGYSQEKVEKKDGSDVTPNGYEITFGMVHRF